MERTKYLARVVRKKAQRWKGERNEERRGGRTYPNVKKKLVISRWEPWERPDKGKDIRTEKGGNDTGSGRTC